jgi:hypothetical protein
MRSGTTKALPASLEALGRRFERWRRSRRARSRIPDTLWTSAVQAAGRYGLHRTTKALRLDYYALKKRVEDAASDREPGREGAATFIELPAPVSNDASECIVELEDPSGAKMRLHLKGGAVPDITALARSFWGIEA